MSHVIEDFNFVAKPASEIWMARHNEDRTPLAELTNADLLCLAGEYRARAAIASTAADRDGLERVAVGFVRIVERRKMAGRTTDASRSVEAKGHDPAA
jgi:hypothetical protein